MDPLGLVDINLFPSNEAIRGYADKVPSNPSTFQVGAHGNPGLIVDEQGKVVSAKELAAMINRSPSYQAGKIVELLSCNTGKGNFPYAQALADELGADVHAPDQYMWYYSDGRTVPMGMTADGKMDHGQLGTVRIFKPAKK
ncbi:hypothetical protein [Cupriavidus sp. SK-4]|uniref:hypothetical protein n=1 Tax=Cupriavidus sp. SK-4 TaxID=574750 RepID=UPI0012681288|nr:hypothetical protein [Cupriavidus sp. SK-4]